MSLPWRTRAFCRVLDLFDRTPLTDRDAAALARARRLTPPHWAPMDRLFGSVPKDVRRWDEAAPTRDGVVRVRHYRRMATSAAGSAAKPLVLYFHGGGWVRGNIEGYDAVCAQVASRVGAHVVSVDYRLAPEHPFPAAVHDTFDVTCWAVTEARRLGADPSRVAVAGDSAGATLAAAVCLLARDHGGPRISAQVLAYPGLDATLSSPSIDAMSAAPMLTRRRIEEYLTLYHPHGDVRDPRLSPLHAASLAGLPRALIQTADHDPLLDDGSRYAEALEAAGVPVRYSEYRDVPHGFLSFPGLAASGDRPMAEIARELREAL